MPGVVGELAQVVGVLVEQEIGNGLNGFPSQDVGGVGVLPEYGALDPRPEVTEGGPEELIGEGGVLHQVEHDQPGPGYGGAPERGFGDYADDPVDGVPDAPEVLLVRNV